MLNSRTPENNVAKARRALRRLDSLNCRMQHAQSEQLAIVEKVAPISESVAHCLAGVVPVFQAKVGQVDLSVLFRFGDQPRTLGQRRMICGTRGQVLFVALAGQDKLGVVPEIRPPPRLSDSLQDRKIAPAMHACCTRAGCRAHGEVKAIPATSARNLIVRC